MGIMAYLLQSLHLFKIWNKARDGIQKSTKDKSLEFSTYSEINGCEMCEGVFLLYISEWGRVG